MFNRASYLYDNTNTNFNNNYNNSNNVRSIYGSSLDDLQKPIYCEMCGLKYDDVRSKNVHQMYYCTGRDLSLETSLMRLRNNLNNNMTKTSFAFPYPGSFVNSRDLPYSMPFGSSSRHDFDTRPLVDDLNTASTSQFTSTVKVNSNTSKYFKPINISI